MFRYIIITGLLFTYTNCRQTAAAQNDLSLLIFTDSIIAYNGKPGDKVTFSKFPAEKTELLALLDKNKAAYGDKLVVLLKVSNSAAMDKVNHVKEWLREAKHNNFSISESDPYDATTFGVRGALWDLSGLALSKIADSEPVATIPFSDDTHTLIIMRDSVYAYRGTDMPGFKRFGIKDNVFHQYIFSLVATTDSSKLVFFLKRTGSCSYKDIVDILDEMTISQAKAYVLVRLTPEEETFFHQVSKDDESSALKPVDVSTSSLNTKPYLLLDIKSNGRLSYQYVKTGDTVTSGIPIKPFTTKNVIALLTKVEKQYMLDLPKTRVVIKGDYNTGFKYFDTLIEGLKQKGIFKYELLTEN